MPDEFPLERWIARMSGTLYWLLYFQVGHDLFPGVPVHSYSAAQDQAVAQRTGGLIGLGERILPPPPPAPDDQGGPLGGPPPAHG